MASPTPLGIHQIATNEQYALVSDLNRVGITTDAALTYVKARAEYLTDKAVADAGALSRQALNELPRHVASEVDRVIGDTREDAAEARSIAQQAYEYNRVLVAPVADVVNEIITDPNTAPGALVAAKVDVSEGPVLASRHGAVADGVADDTAALQSAIDEAALTGRRLHIGPGPYRTSAPLLLPAAITIEGAGAVGGGFDAVASAEQRTRIMSYGTATFAPANPAEPNCSLTMRDIGLSDRSGNPRSVCFAGLNLRGARLQHVTAQFYDVFAEGPGGGTKACVTAVSVIRDCTIVGIREAVFRGGVIDSHIVNNYLNAASGKYNAYMWSAKGSSTSLLAGNYIDFFTHVLLLDGPHDMITIADNLIGFCWKVVAPPTGTIRAFARGAVTGNTIQGASVEHGLPYFGAATAEMQSGPWAAMDLAGAVGLAGVGNVFLNCDTAWRFSQYKHNDVQVRANTYTGVTTPVDWQPAYSNDFERIHIEPLHGARVATLPSAAFTPGWKAYSYPGQVLNYNGKMVHNDAGVWRDALGQQVT